MKHIYTYRVITKEVHPGPAFEMEVTRFEEEVNKAMDEGYRPVGGVSLTSLGSACVYAQTLIKKEQRTREEEKEAMEKVIKAHKDKMEE